MNEGETMDLHKALTLAKTLRHRFLLPTKAHEEAFLRNENASALTYGETVFLLDCEDSCDLYFATENPEELPEAFAALRMQGPKGRNFAVHATESAETAGAIDSVLPLLKEAGCSIREEYIAFRTKKPLSEFAIQSDAVRMMREKEGYLVYSMALVLLDEAKFAMSYEAFERFANAKDSVCLVLEDEGIVKGFAMGKVYGRPNEKSLFVRGMGVERTYQGFGISKLLLGALFKWGMEKGAQSSMLWVEQKNIRAIGLYERFAYVPYGDREVVLTFKT